MSSLQIGIHRNGDLVILRDGLAEILLTPKLAKEAAKEMLRTAQRIETRRTDTIRIIRP